MIPILLQMGAHKHSLENSTILHLLAMEYIRDLKLLNKDDTMENVKQRWMAKTRDVMAIIERGRHNAIYQVDFMYLLYDYMIPSVYQIIVNYPGFIRAAMSKLEEAYDVSRDLYENLYERRYNEYMLLLQKQPVQGVIYPYFLTL